jgi:hypothetical protein
MNPCWTQYDWLQPWAKEAVNDAYRQLDAALEAHNLPISVAQEKAILDALAQALINEYGTEVRGQ